MPHLSKKHHAVYGVGLFAALIIVPVFLWLAHDGLSPVTQNPMHVILALAKASAFIGLVTYCLEPVLSMRHHIIEKLFGGLDHLYHLHIKAGKMSFFFILAHPLLLAIGGFLGGGTILTIWNWGSTAVLVGIFSLVAIIILTILSVYAHLKHQRWVAVHRLFGWIVPLLFIHALLSKSQLTTIRPLFIYIMTIGSLGFAAFLYRSVFSTFIRKYRYEIAEVHKVNESVTELVLKPLGVPLIYNSGQYAYMSLRSKGLDGEAHPYSFTTANNGPYIRFAIKELGDDTANMKWLQPGIKVFLEGPHGSFSYQNSKATSQVWIAGGVGITPFLSMARSLTPGGKHRIHLFYAADKLQDAVFLSELIAIHKTIPDNFEFTLVNREWSGFVTIEVLSEYIKDFKKDDYFICGSPLMLKKLKFDLAIKGVSKKNIFTEEFSVL